MCIRLDDGRALSFHQGLLTLHSAGLMSIGVAYGYGRGTEDPHARLAHRNATSSATDQQYPNLAIVAVSFFASGTMLC